jgi:Glycosyltransferase 61
MRPVLRKQHGRVFVAAVSATRVLGTLLHRRSETPPRRYPTSVADLGTQAGCSTDRIEAGGIVRPRIPDGLPPFLEEIFAEVVPVELPPLDVVTISAGIVSADDGWISRDRRPDRAGVELPGTTVSMLAPHPSLYYHWLIDVAPRTAMVLDRIPRDELHHVLVPPRLERFHLDLLDVLEVDPERRVEASEVAYRCERVICITEANAGGFVRGSAAHALRHAFGLADAGAGRARLYIGRDDASGRRVVNEGEVVATLERYGFEATTMANRSMREQAALFASAEVIVAPHGGALANLVFAPERSALIELIPANYVSAYYFLLAASRGIAYDAVMGIEPRALRALRRELWHADLIVDVPALERKVARLLSEGGDPHRRSGP